MLSEHLRVDRQDQDCSRNRPENVDTGQNPTHPPIPARNPKQKHDLEQFADRFTNQLAYGTFPDSCLLAVRPLRVLDYVYRRTSLKLTFSSLPSDR